MNGLLEIINGWAGAWAAAMVRASWQGGIALAAAWGISFALRHGPARVRCWLWRAGFAKLALAALVPGMLALPWIHWPTQPTPQTLPSVSTLEIAEFPSPANTSTMHPPPLIPQPAPAERLSWEACAMALWLTGITVGGVGIAPAWQRAITLRRTSIRLHEGPAASCCEQMARTLHIRMPELRIGDELAGPMLVGWIRPAILLPAGLENSPPARLVLAHELAHVARRDLWWNWLLTGALLAFWFHPLVWLGRRAWAESMEMACDEQALLLTGAQPAAYGRMLVAMARRRAPARVMGVGVADSTGTLFRRLKAMGTINTWSRRRVVGTASVLVMLVGMAALPWRVAQAQEQATSGAPTHRAGPATTQREWQLAFDEMYTLKAGEFLKLVRKPFIEARHEYFVDVDHDKNGSDELFQFHQFRYDGQQVKREVMVGAPTIPLNAVVRWCAGLEESRVEIDPELENMNFLGDWIVQDKATPEQVLGGLVDILKEAYGVAARVEKEEQERDVVVVRGKYVPHLLPEALGGASIEIYGTELNPTRDGEWAGGGTKARGDFWKFIGKVVTLPVVDEGTGEPEKISEEISWSAMEVKEDAELRKVLLENVGKQMGLTLKVEKRKVEVWRIKWVK